jgi:phage shock protein E
MFQSVCAEIKELLLKGAQLLDVRTPMEFAQGALPGALNIPVQILHGAIDRLDPDTPVLVYCRSGHRSAHATRWLQSVGFKKVIDLGGAFYYLPCVPEIKAARLARTVAA